MAKLNKDQLHHRINELIDSIQNNNNRLLLQDGRFPQIEIDLLRKSAIELYDSINLLHLENLKSKKIEKQEVKPKVENTIKDQVVKKEELKEDPIKPNIGDEELSEKIAKTKKAEIDKLAEQDKHEKKSVEKKADKKVVEPKIKSVEPILEKQEPIAIVNKENSEDPKSEEKILNPQKSSEKKSGRLHDRLKNSKISSIKKAISISKRYELQHELFSDNKGLYNKVLDELDAMSSVSEADTYFDSLVNDNGWDADSKLVQEFYTYILRRHS